MPRVRQFSAERKELSQSRLYESRKIAPNSNISHSRVQKYQIATPIPNKKQSNQKSLTNLSNLSGSRMSQKSSNSQYICTGCFNYKLASDRKETRRNQLLQEKQRQKNYTQTSLKQDHEEYLKHSKLISNFNDVKQYNRKLIQQKQKSKLKQLQLKQLLIQQQKSQNQQYLSREKQQKTQKQKAHHNLLKDIQQQIHNKKLKQKQIRDQQEQFNQPNSIFGEAQQIYFKEKAKRQNQYRQEILKQIQQRQIQLQKQQAQQKDFQNIGFGITEAAYRRQLQRQKIYSERQNSLLQEAKRRREVKQIQLQQERKTQQFLQKQRMRLQQQQMNLEKQFSSDKKRQVQQYLQDISKQIQDKKKRREKQVKEDHELTQTSVDIVQKKVDNKSCKSCEKKFAKTFLTKLK